MSAFAVLLRCICTAISVYFSEFALLPERFTIVVVLSRAFPGLLECIAVLSWCFCRVFAVLPLCFAAPLRCSLVHTSIAFAVARGIFEALLQLIAVLLQRFFGNYGALWCICSASVVRCGAFAVHWQYFRSALAALLRRFDSTFLAQCGAFAVLLRCAMVLSLCFRSPIFFTFGSASFKRFLTHEY
jgi:hypothetical protein